MISCGSVMILGEPCKTRRRDLIWHLLIDFIDTPNLGFYIWKNDISVLRMRLCLRYSNKEYGFACQCYVRFESCAS